MLTISSPNAPAPVVGVDLFGRLPQAAEFTVKGAANIYRQVNRCIVFGMPDHRHLRQRPLPIVTYKRSTAISDLLVVKQLLSVRTTR